jgi:hypothetical protein
MQIYFKSCLFLISIRFNDHPEGPNASKVQIKVIFAIFHLIYMDFSHIFKKNSFGGRNSSLTEESELEIDSESLYQCRRVVYLDLLQNFRHRSQIMLLNYVNSSLRVKIVFFEIRSHDPQTPPTEKSKTEIMVKSVCDNS